MVNDVTAHDSESVRILTEYFPEHMAFRVGQEDGIARIVADRNVLCLMPTGGGKSLVYQVGGIRRGGTTLVISPLIALMAQQVERLASKPGVIAQSLSDYSGLKLYETLRRFDFAADASFVFTSPERLSFDGYLEFVLQRARASIRLVVVDEAHCVSQWGHTFRPAYKAIPRCLDTIFGPQNWPPVLCLTATLNPHDRGEICRDFRIAAEDIVTTPIMHRKNLTLRCEHHEDETAKTARLGELLTQHAGEKVLVYVHRKRGEHGTEALAARFGAEGLDCGYFDADRADDEKRAVLTAFQTGETKVVFATSAFGMGIDIPDVRAVIHYLLPESIEQYYQEVGRAGRDGVPAFGFLLFSNTNLKVRRQLIEKSIVNRDEMDAMFTTKVALREGDTVRTIAQYDDIAESKGELTAWFLFQLAGVVHVVAKGPSAVHCFVPGSNGGTLVLEYQHAASSAGLVKTISRKLGKPTYTILSDLWRLYHEGGAKLASSPSHALFFTAPHLPPEEKLDEIAADQQEKLKFRLEGYEALVELVKAGGDPTAGICAHLGLPPP